MTSNIIKNNIHKDSNLIYFDKFRSYIIINKNSKNYLSQLKFYINHFNYRSYNNEWFELSIKEKPVVIVFYLGFLVCYFRSDHNGYVYLRYYDFWESWRVKFVELINKVKIDIYKPLVNIKNESN